MVPRSEHPRDGGRIDNSDPLHGLGIVKGHAFGAPTRAVMTDDAEFFMSKSMHQMHLIPRNGSFCVWNVTPVRFRFAAVATAVQV
jgi:hypothetical protein